MDEPKHSISSSKRNKACASFFLAITMKNWINERHKKINKNYFIKIMLLFCCRKKYERREGMAPPYLRLQKLLKELRLRVATNCPPRFKNYFFATKMFHCANVNPIYICGLQIIIYFIFHGMCNGVLTPPQQKYAPVPPKKNWNPLFLKTFNPIPP